MSSNVYDFCALKRTKLDSIAATFCDNKTLNQVLNSLSDRIVYQYQNSVEIHQPIDEQEALVNEQIIDSIRVTYSISTDHIHHTVEVNINNILSQLEVQSSGAIATASAV